MHYSFLKRCRAFTLIETLVVIGIVGILMGLLLVAIQSVRGAMNKFACQNRIRQLGLAMQQYHDTFRFLPPGHRSANHTDKMRFTGWTLSLLPYVEQQALQQSAMAAFLVEADPFKTPPHLLDAVVPIFVCPSDGRVSQSQISLQTKNRAAFTSYLGISGIESADKLGVLFQDSQINLSQILDGTSNTLLFGERPPSHDFQFGWWYAGAGQGFSGSADLILGVNERNLLPISTGSPCGPGNYSFGPSYFSDPCGMFHYWSPHSGGASFAFADGSVRFVGYEANTILKKLATRAGNDPETLP